MSGVQVRSRYRVFCAVSLILLSLAAIAYGAHCVWDGRWIATKPGEEDAPKSGGDFTAFYSAGELARQHKDIYKFKSSSTPRRPFEYPPMFAVFPMAPLSLLSHNTALAVFYALNAILLAAGCVLLRKLLWPSAVNYDREPRLWLTPMAGMLASLVLCWRFIGSNTSNSNANLIILFLLIVGLYFDRSEPRPQGSVKRGIVCGLSVALATAIKLTPGLFGIYFLWGWRRWAMLGGALGLALFFLLIPAAWLGWDANSSYLRRYSKFVAGRSVDAQRLPEQSEQIDIGWERQNDLSQSDIAVGSNASVRGMLVNLLTPAVSLKKHGDRPRTVNIAALDTKTVNTIASVSGLLLLLATVAQTFGARAKRSPHALALTWSLITVTMTLISPLTRIAHLVVLLIPIATLLALLQQNLLHGAAKTFNWIALSMLALSGLMPEYVRAVGFMTLTLLVLYVGLGLALRQPEDSQ
jgi:hypothetical protein